LRTLASSDPDKFFDTLTALMLASQQGFALFDDKDQLIFANPVFRAVFDLEEEEFPSWAEMMKRSYEKAAGAHVETDDFDTWLRSAQSRRGKMPYRTIETEMVDGRWVLTTETTLPGGWMLCVITDISELGVDLRALRQERDKALVHAWSDPLTGLSNRRYLMEKLGTLFSPSREVRASVIILDIDFFKNINDTYGHDFGDEVLCHFGATLQRAASRDDLIGRLGGEEFILVVNSTSVDEIKARLDAFYEAMRNGLAFAKKPEFSYSCSAGIAIAQPGEIASDVMRRADQALYRAKTAGRDQYKFAN